MYGVGQVHSLLPPYGVVGCDATSERPAVAESNYQETAVTRITAILLSALILTVSACGRKEASDSAAAGPATDTASQSEMATAAPDASATANQDQAFFDKAAEGGMAEVEAGSLAQEKASSSDVKKFGAMMVQDHTQANEKLKGIAAAHGVTLPTSLNAEHDAMKMRLAGLSGNEFDKEYIRGQIKDHEATVELLRTESASGENTDAKAFAAETLPTVEAHLKRAQELGAKLKVDVN